MSATSCHSFSTAPTTSGDWSQQELAEFYRVEAASIQAGLRLSLDRGVTDEVDPWLVFCREDGEVFLHFARIDGSYVIVSDMVGEPLVGPELPRPPRRARHPEPERAADQPPGSRRALARAGLRS